MPIYKNINGIRKKAKFAFYGNNLLPEIYYGNKKVFEMNGVIFESSTPNTYTIHVSLNGYYDIKLVGGGGGGHTDGAGYHPYNYGGGSGAYVYGTMYLSSGDYTVVVGAASGGNTKGGDSSFEGQIAGGGQPSTGGGGVATTTLSYINGNNGGFGNVYSGPGGASVYNGYGTGATANNGGLSGQTNGYARIEFVGTQL